MGRKLPLPSFSGPAGGATLTLAVPAPTSDTAIAAISARSASSASLATQAASATRERTSCRPLRAA